MNTPEPEPNPGVQITRQTQPTFDGVAVRSTVQQIGTVNISAQAGNPDAYLELGDVAFGARNFSEALSYYDKALAFDPKFAFAWVGRGLALKKLGREREAQESFSKAEELRSPK